MYPVSWGKLSLKGDEAMDTTSMESEPISISRGSSGFWHVHVLNNWHDFCYVTLETVRLHLHKRNCILDPIDPRRSTDGGYIL